MVSGLVLARTCVPPHGTVWQAADGDSTIRPCSPPRSDVFIAVVVGCRWTPLSPLAALHVPFECECNLNVRFECE
jgi:hypothetical protein